MGVLAGTSVAVDDPLALHSVKVLRSGQAPSGAFIASPTFPVYRYAWLRDGAFCASALDVVGRREEAAAFHQWVIRSIEEHRSMIESAIELVGSGQTPPPEAMPPARYTLDGALERGEVGAWPNFQVDGYGTWLWSYAEHVGGDRLTEEAAAAVRLVARYLQASWRLKCFNCWEEFDGGEHASTRAAVVAGLVAAASLLDDAEFAAEADRVRTDLFEGFVVDGRFARARGDARLDGSLLWLAIPFRVLSPDEPRIVATVEAVRRELTGPEGGVYRYRGDTYYGGGEWLLLTSSLAWHDELAGKRDGWSGAQAWVRAQALPSCDLPEQVSGFAQQREMIEPWLRRWGPIATPLLWSHAMYLIAESAAC
jgi:GH15 family glucan-1,4-alpha-glucosidase